MLEWLAPLIALLCAIAACGLLVALSVIDLRVRLLPNKLVLPLAILGVIFHTVMGWAYITPLDMIAGGAMGFGILYGIRYTANRLYKMDTLGLGDVKLMGAAGLWLGPDGVLMALILGAMLGMAHGLIVAFYLSRQSGKKINLNTLEVPAGPGFALGIAVMGFHQFLPF
jgi:leader peptidase (prepilin peptidase)/N-methyltransferase